MMTTFPSINLRVPVGTLHVPAGHRLRLFALLATAAILLVLNGPARAQAFAQESSLNISFSASPKEPVPVYVLNGQSVLVVFDQAIGRLAVSNSDVAEAVLVAPNQMMINGKASGRVTFTAWSKDTSTFVFFNVDVRVNLAQLDAQVRALFPNMDIRLSQANGAVVISGSIPPAMMKQVETVVQAAGYKTVNLIGQSVEHIAQVQLSVKVAEVSRNKLSEFAYAPVYQPSAGKGVYTNTGSGPYSVGSVTAGNIIGTVASNLNVFFMSNNVFNFIHALQTQGALRSLSEPNLVAMDGQEASFLAGGEIPVPIASIQGTTIQWKDYGIKLRFKPTILDEQHIRLDIEPEVSSLDFANSLQFNGFLIPALRTRKAKTGIELQNGQTFGIAGLMDNSETKALGKLPLLADVPIIGELFKSKSFKKNETELVFIVTTKVVKPWEPDEVPTIKGVDKLSSGSAPLGVSTSEATPPKPNENKSGKSGEASKEEMSKDTAPKDAPAEMPKETPGEPKEPVKEPVKEPGKEMGKEMGKEAGKEMDKEPSAPAEGVTPPTPVNPGEKPAVAPESNGAAPPTSDPNPPSNTSPSAPTSNEKPANPTSEDKPKPAAPANPTVKPATERAARPEQAVQALQWRLKVPSPAAAVTAQTRP